MQDTPSASETRPYLPTIVAMGLAAYALSNLVHEGIGHAATCALLGGNVRVLNALYCLYDYASLSPAGNRLAAAGGTLVNLVLGILLLVLLRRLKNASPQTRYFLWLTSWINLLQAGGYLMVSPFLGYGDWAAFLYELPNALVWKIGLTFVGINLWFMGWRVGQIGAARMVAPGSVDAGRRLAALTLTPYLAGFLLMLAAHGLDPTHSVMGKWAALGTTACGTWPLAFLPLLWARSRTTTSAALATTVPPVTRSLSWLVIGFVSALLFLIILGPGWRFSQ